MANGQDGIKRLARSIEGLSELYSHMPLSTVRILLAIAIDEETRPNASEGMHIAELSARCNVGPSLVTRWVQALSTAEDNDTGKVGKLLTQRGLLNKRLGPGGRITVTLTVKGRTIIDQIANRS